MLPFVAIAVFFIQIYARFFCSKGFSNFLLLKIFHSKKDDSMSAFHVGWYLLYTKFNTEKKVAINLKEKTIDCFLPVIKVLRQRKDRRKVIEQPLFPSYVFVYLENLNSYYEGLHTNGVINYVRQGKDIAKVPDTIIRSISIAVNQSNHVEISSGQFCKGENIVITGGPMAGLCGEVIQYYGGKKILVRLNVIQRNILVNLHSDHLVSSSNYYSGNAIQIAADE